MTQREHLTAAWDQQLRAHFHVHCLIPGGALSADRSHWLPAKPKFLFAVRALSKVFRGKFLDGLRQLYVKGKLVFPAAMTDVASLADADAFNALLAHLRGKPWVVYSKARPGALNTLGSAPLLLAILFFFLTKAAPIG